MRFEADYVKYVNNEGRSSRKMKSDLKMIFWAEYVKIYVRSESRYLKTHGKVPCATIPQLLSKIKTCSVWTRSGSR